MQGVAVGDDVAGSGQGGADKGVGFVVGAGVAGAGEDPTGQGLCGVERGDADGVVADRRSAANGPDGEGRTGLASTLIPLPALFAD